MKNNDKKRFLDYVRKLNDTDIVLKYKLKSIYNKKIFFFKKIIYF